MRGNKNNKIVVSVIPIFLTIPNYFEFHVASVPNLDEDTGLCQTLYYVKVDKSL